VSAWGRALGASARVWVPVAAAVTAAQTLLVVGDPVPLASVGFVALALGSGAAFAIGLWLVSRALTLAVAGEPVRWRSVLTAHPALVWAIVVVVLLVLLGLLSPYLTVVGLWFGLLVMPAAAAGASNPLPAAGHTIRCQPVRMVLAALIVAVVWALGAVGMLLLGFFVTGPLSVALTWIALTMVGTVVLAVWTDLYSRARITR
jgi:hypothetical protein